MLCRPSTGTLPSRASFGVRPFSGGALWPSLPLPPGCWFFRGLAFFLRGALRPSLLALQLSRGFSDLLPCLSGLCRPSGSNLRGSSFGVRPFLGGLVALPACPTTESRFCDLLPCLSGLCRPSGSNLRGSSFGVGPFLGGLVALPASSWGALWPSLLLVLGVGPCGPPR